jgi:hypothetical protein
VLMMTARSQTLHRTRRRRADSGTLVVAAELHLAELPKSAIDVCYTSGVRRLLSLVRPCLRRSVGLSRRGRHVMAARVAVLGWLLVWFVPHRGRVVTADKSSVSTASDSPHPCRGAFTLRLVAT